MRSKDYYRLLELYNYLHFIFSVKGRGRIKSTFCVATIECSVKVTVRRLLDLYWIYAITSYVLLCSCKAEGYWEDVLEYIVLGSAVSEYTV